MGNLSDAFKTAAKDALMSAADVAILQAAAKADQERETSYSALEAKKTSAAESIYKTKFVGQKLVKAALIPRDGEQAKTIEFMFNPTDLQFSRKVTIADMEGARTVRGLPKVNFGFVEPYQLKLAGLVFDTYETGENVFNKIQPILDAVDFSSFVDPYKQEDGYQERVVGVNVAEAGVSAFVQSIGGQNVLGVREYGSEKVGQQALKLRRPPVYYFIWGEKNYLRCMIENLNYKLTMFLPNGTPVRAMVDLDLKEVDLGVASREFSQRQKFISG